MYREELLETLGELIDFQQNVLKHRECMLNLESGDILNKTDIESIQDICYSINTLEDEEYLYRIKNWIIEEESTSVELNTGIDASLWNEELGDILQEMLERMTPPELIKKLENI